MQGARLSAAPTKGFHLVRRFLGTLRARPLGPEEQDLVAGRLPPPLAALFWSQQAADQRHALEVARRVARVLPDDGELFVAALLHDVGKAATRLGVVRRVVATVCDAVRLPLPTRWRAYRGHGPLGARLLRDAGADGIVVAFAAGHPGPPPPDVEPSRWEALAAADET